MCVVCVSDTIELLVLYLCVCVKLVLLVCPTLECLSKSLLNDLNQILNTSHTVCHVVMKILTTSTYV